MSEEIKKDQMSGAVPSGNAPSRRKLLKLGAASVPAIVTLSGGNALAQTQVSLGLANCTVSLSGAQVDAAKSLNGPTVTGSAPEELTGQQIYNIYDSSVNSTGYDTGYMAELEKIVSAGLNGSGISCITSITMRLA